MSNAIIELQFQIETVDGGFRVLEALAANGEDAVLRPMPYIFKSPAMAMEAIHYRVTLIMQDMQAIEAEMRDNHD